MKVYRCKDCSGPEIPMCMLYIEGGDASPPNTCPYRYGETWEKSGGKCGWEFVGVSAEMPMESGPLSTWRCDCGALHLSPHLDMVCCRCGAAYTPDKREGA